MLSLTLKIAELSLKIKFSNQKWLEFCRQKFRPFIIDGAKLKPNLTIRLKTIPRAKLEDIRWTYKSPRLTQLLFPDALRYFQWLNYDIKIVLSGILLMRNGCFIHGSSVVTNDGGLIFAGKSGQGKSTVAKILKLPTLADDRSIIRFIKRQPFVFGSPFYERRPFAKVPGRYRLKAIFMLKKDKVRRLKIEKTSPKQAMFRLIPHIVVNETVPARVLKHQYLKAFDLAKLLARTVPVYNLSFPLSCESAKLKKSIYEAIN